MSAKSYERGKRHADDANCDFSEMFLGPAHRDFQFQPKHKSNSYEIEAEG